MNEQAYHIIQQMTRRWKHRHALAFLLRVIAVSLPLVVIAVLIFSYPWWWVPLIVSGTTVLLRWWWPLPVVSEIEISSFLNHRYPELQESVQLLLVPPAELNHLQLMQRSVTAEKITQIGTPPEINASLKSALLVFFLTLSCTVLVFFSSRYFTKTSNGRTAVTPVVHAEKEVPPAGISSFKILVTPPAYTGKPQREENSFSLSVEDGSVVSWTIHSNGVPPALGFIFNNGIVSPLKPSADSLSWTFSKTLSRSGFYQVDLGGTLSSLYQLELIPDKAPVIQVLAPAQHSSFQPGVRPVLQVRTSVTDDYGIRSVQLVLTKASGKGEAVSFREEVMEFAHRTGTTREQMLIRQLDLWQMGMKAGDELYFYIRVMDNHGQESRSDMFFVSLPDTEELLSLSSLTSGVDQVPEYFRSQRQIILDTEKLLKEKGSIPVDSFRLRSNELGSDQKLLRLRYGKFLGEENESGIHTPDDGHDHAAEPPAYGDVQALMDQYAHKHDNAEDAGFFEPAQKAQLKAVLEEMWKSELKLRTYLPADALPFEYKALVLLKDLQQKSRAYVGKTSAQKATLNPDKRLSGDQSKIRRDPSSGKSEMETEPAASLRAAISIVENRKLGGTDAAVMEILRVAEQALGQAAIRDPAHYLTALSIMGEFRKGETTVSGQQVRQLQAALAAIIGQTVTSPAKRAATGGLADQYFNQLNKTR
ncbi:MAG: DUF4175 family protein [Chitinophagaceae bacterium]|nr:MAG: DUF4175 family protein [Chitinophagaceae bacterium]